MKKYIQSSWNGQFSPTFIMKNSNITDRAEASKLADYLWEKGYDCGFETKEQWLRTFDFDNIYAEMKKKEVKSSSKVEASFSRSSFDSLRGNDKEDQLRYEWYNEESYPDVDPERLKDLIAIKWDGVSAEDSECILYDNIDLKPIRKIAYLDDYDMEKASEQGFEGGYEITYKDGTVKLFGWRPYPHNLDPLVEIDASTKVRKKKVNASSRFDKLNQAKKELMKYDKEKVDYVRQCQDEIMKEISRYYEESEDNDEAVGPRLSSIKSDFIEEALEDDLMTEDEFEDILSLLDQIDIYLGNPGE